MKFQEIFGPFWATWPVFKASFLWVFSGSGQPGSAPVHEYQNLKFRLHHRMEKPTLMDQNATPFLVQLIIFSFPCHFPIPFLGYKRSLCENAQSWPKPENLMKHLQPETVIQKLKVLTDTMTFHVSDPIVIQNNHWYQCIRLGVSRVCSHSCESTSRDAF